MLKFISDNAIVSALIAAVVIAAASGLWKWWRDRKDSKIVYDFLLASKTETSFSFRSTEAISSHTKLSEKRVAELCSKHPKIRRNEKEKQSWTLIA
jgi:flavin-dependent dehydrogenase